MIKTYYIAIAVRNYKNRIHNLISIAVHVILHLSTKNKQH